MKYQSRRKKRNQIQWITREIVADKPIIYTASYFFLKVSILLNCLYLSNTVQCTEIKFYFCAV